jgi:AAA family ATP:ADP antiporter
MWGGFKLVLSSPYLLGICLLMLFLTTLATFLYFQQAQIIRDNFADPSQRTTVFAAMDLAVNALTVVFQLFLTGRLVKRIGLPWTLALVPLLLGFGFLALGVAPLLAVLVVVQVLRRAGNYAIMRPAREMLYSVLGKEEKYKAKNLIDTAVYRGGDALSAWAYAGLASLGLGLSAIALIAVPLAGLWAWVAYALGGRRDALADASKVS